MLQDVIRKKLSGLLGSLKSCTTCRGATGSQSVGPVLWSASHVQFIDSRVTLRCRPYLEGRSGSWARSG
jgi:hypothetical protein